MNWKEASQPREIEGLNMPNIEIRIEAIQNNVVEKVSSAKKQKTRISICSRQNNLQ